jgi:hypothetical protein
MNTKLHERADTDVLQLMFCEQLKPFWRQEKSHLLTGYSDPSPRESRDLFYRNRFVIGVVTPTTQVVINHEQGIKEGHAS